MGTDTATLPARHIALDALADLYRYPTVVRCEVVRDLAGKVVADCPETLADLAPLVALLSSGPIADAEELYVRTIELNPVCALEIGWQLYGEQYARGAFLVRTRQLLRDAGLPETTELPDHLTNVLLILGRLDGPSIEKLAVRFTLPAVRGMHEKLAADPDNPLRGLLAATVKVLERHFGAEVERE